MTTRLPRVARAARPARRNPRAALVPPADVRRRRGPKPPDTIIARLERALAAEIERALAAGLLQNDADLDARPMGFGERWRAALLLGLIAIQRGARRGVVAALAGTAAAALAGAERTAPSGLDEHVTVADISEQVATAVRERRRVLGAGAALAALLAAGAAVLAQLLMNLHTAIVRAIATATGASLYVWTTMRDTHVRELHQKLEGTIQRWDAPPLAGLPAFHGHPGEAAGCRCQPFPLPPR